MPQMQVIRRGLDPRRAALAAGIQSGAEAIGNAGQRAAMMQYQQQNNDNTTMMNFGRLLNSAETQQQADNIMALGQKMGIDTSGFSWSPPQQQPNEIDLARYQNALDQLNTIDASIMAAGEGWEGSPVSGQGWGNADGSFNQQMHDDVKLQNRSWTHHLPLGDGYNTEKLANFEKIEPLFNERSKYQQVLDDFDSRFSSSSPSVRAASDVTPSVPGAVSEPEPATGSAGQGSFTEQDVIDILGDTEINLPEGKTLADYVKAFNAKGGSAQELAELIAAYQKNPN